MACGLLSREGRWGYPRQRKSGGRTICLVRGCSRGLGVAGVGRTLRLPGHRCPSEPARPPSALPERHSGPSPSVSVLAPHHSCRPHHPQGRLPSRPEDLIPHSPTSLPQGWAPQLRASPSQTRGPQQSGLAPSYRGGKGLTQGTFLGQYPQE